MKTQTKTPATEMPAMTPNDDVDAPVAASVKTVGCDDGGDVGDVLGIDVGCEEGVVGCAVG